MDLRLLCQAEQLSGKLQTQEANFFLLIGRKKIPLIIKQIEMTLEKSTELESLITF